MPNRSLRSLAAVLAASALFPTGAWSQDPAANPPAASQAPAVNQPEATTPAPAPAPTPQAEPAPADKTSVPIPAVTVTAPPPRRAVAPQPAQRAEIAPRPVVAAPRPAVTPPAPATPAASVEGRPAPGALPVPPGQTVTSISGETIKNAPAFSIQDLLQESPGISIKQGNGPRDVGISIRGSNARNGFGIRNIVVLEDGFPVTQPDGLSRTDLTDPHAYGGVDVYRGPSSAMFGNYATGGAINFRLRRGGEINGAIYGIEGGSFGYLNNYALIGKQTGNFEGSLFASDVRGNGYISHSSFNTQTLNSLMTYAPTPNDRVTLKVIENALTTNLSIRLSLNQFVANPLQRGCTIASTAAAGCATVNLFANGFSAPTVAQSADQAALGRHDHRNIVGARWEHDFDNQTTWRTQLVFDDKNINQPTGTTSAIGDSPSYNLISDFTARGRGVFGLDATHYLAFFYNRQRLTNFTWNVTPGGGLGALASFYDGGQHENLGGRAREEIRLGPSWTAYAAVGVEYTNIAAVNTIYSFPGVVAVPAFFPINRDFLNWAPEGGLLYRPNDAWQFRGRVATGYGTPNIGSLTVTSAGVSGNNSQLQSQHNLGIDLGADWTPASWLKLSVTGFYEWFRDEQVTQSPGAGLQNFTFNVPRSIHQGVELAADWRPLPGWRFLTAYTYIDQYYREYIEQLSAAPLTRQFDRRGNKIPGVSPNEVFARLGYDQPTGPWKGVGGFVEYIWKDTFYMENANLLRAPGYGLFNVNVHYDAEVMHEHLKGAIFFFEVKNVLDTTYVASANNITNSISAVTGLQNPGSVLATTGTGSIYAGAPRTFVAGMKLAFR
jgi:iron complex outermembrane receptor protein